MRQKEDLEQLIKNVPIHTNPEVNKSVLRDLVSILDETRGQKTSIPDPSVWRFIVRSKAINVAAACFVIASLVTILILSRSVKNLRHELELSRRDIAMTRIGNSATINLYLREHQDIVARHASLNPTMQQSLQMRVNQHDILYYEILEEQPEYMRPGIIVRGPSLQREISLSETPVISNGHTLTLSEAHVATNFDLVVPPRLHPCYRLDQIRRITGRNAIQLLYTDGINSVSLFEQPLEGELGLSPQDFREYSVYLNKELSGGTILAWTDDALSYVLISNIEISQLMDLAQSISVRNERE